MNRFGSDNFGEKIFKLNKNASFRERRLAQKDRVVGGELDTGRMKKSVIHRYPRH
jgi:hypothetical protein